MDKKERDNRHISVNDDYIELSDFDELTDDYIDIYSDTSRDIYSDSSNDVYIGRKSKNMHLDDEDAVYIGRNNQQRNRNYTEPLNRYETRNFTPVNRQKDVFEHSGQKINTQPPIQQRRRPNVSEDEISDFEARHGKTGNRNKKEKKPAVAVLSIVLAVILGLGAIVFLTANSVVGKFQDGEKIEHVDDVELKTASYVKNVLLIGSDKKTGDSSRSDSIMIASVNSKTGKITIVSILRDTHLYVPGKQEAKINAAYSWGGPNLLIQTIEHNFHIKIDDYATVDFDMFEALVDGIGGIYVDVSEAEAAHLNSHFKLGTEGKPEPVQSGENVYLDGYHALCYARIRKLDSDFNRTERQRKVIAAIMANVKEDLNPAGIFTLLGTAQDVAPYIETTLSQADFWSLIMKLGGSYVRSAGDVDNMLVNAKIPFDDTWWYSSQWDGSSISINLEENRDLLHQLLFAESVTELPQTTEEQE